MIVISQERKGNCPFRLVFIALAVLVTNNICSLSSYRLLNMLANCGSGICRELGLHATVKNKQSTSNIVDEISQSSIFE